MKRCMPITRAAAAPQAAASLLEKTLFWNNLLDAVATAQEVSDLLTKSDTHDNN